MTTPQELNIVEVVTREHGETFAEWWGEVSRRSGALTEASAETGIMTFPDDPKEQERYHAIEHEIARRVFSDLHWSIADTFVRIANEVLTKERGGPMSPPAKLNIVDSVTRAHGETFADEWFEGSFDTSAITEAITDTEIMQWPYDRGDGDDLFLNIQDEISQRVCDQLRSAAVETFVRIANEVLTRRREE